MIGGYALGALGSVLLILAFLGADARLFPRWVVYLGRISFGLYVYHMFAIGAVRALFGPFAAATVPVHALMVVLSLGLTFLMAAVSYRYFETPFLKLKKRLAVIESQPIGAFAEPQ